MTIAHVVPLRRLPTVHDWFDYTVPVGLDIRPGQLVRIPFRRQFTDGIVWSIDEHSDADRLKPISQVREPAPLVVPWQREAIARIADHFCATIPQIVSSLIPPPLKRPQPAWSGAVLSQRQPSRLPETWWYTDRTRVTEDMVAWILAGPIHEPRVMILPTKDDIDLIRQRIGSKDIIYVHGSMTPAAYRLAYRRVLAGQITRVVGTSRSMLLPFAAPPRILLDQEDHPSHKQHDRHPRLDGRIMAELIGSLDMVTTAAPTVRWWHAHHPTPVAPTASKRAVVDLQLHRSAIRWLSQPASDLLEQASSRQPVVLIVPRPGYAGSAVCSECGFAVPCPHCHRRLMITGAGRIGVCRFCNHDVTIPAACPKCRNTNFSWQAIGSDRLRSMIAEKFPALILSTAEKPSSSTAVWITTLPLFKLSALAAPIRHIVIINGDSFASTADFSGPERTWLTLWRMQAAAPAACITVQASDPQALLWQRWREGDHARWYAHELRDRTRWHTPPIFDQWLIQYSGPQAERQCQDMMNRLRRDRDQVLTVVPLSPSQKHSSSPIAHRFVITAKQPGLSLETILDWRHDFPPPWQIDAAVDRWS